jgi:hypothetical protein
MEDGGASLSSGMPLTYWAASATQLLTFDVIVINSTAAGNIQLQWAQNTAHASNLTFGINSYLMAWTL